MFVENDTDELIYQFIEYLERIHHEAERLTLNEMSGFSLDDLKMSMVKKYCAQIPVLGFNSSRYYLPVLIKK